MFEIDVRVPRWPCPLLRLLLRASPQGLPFGRHHDVDAFLLAKSRKRRVCVGTAILAIVSGHLCERPYI